MYPFNDSKIIARKGTQWTIHPGVGRYSIKTTKCKQRKKQSWMFKSKVQRTTYKVPDYTDF